MSAGAAGRGRILDLQVAGLEQLLDGLLQNAVGNPFS